MTIVEVVVEKVRMFAHHGIHVEERVAGAEFEVSVRVEYIATGMISDLESTIDYTRVLHILRQEMEIPTPLLETVCMTIAEKVKAEFAKVRGINITIRKINPPVANFHGQLSVSIHKTYES